MVALLKNIFMPANQRILHRISKFVTKVNSIESSLTELSDEDLAKRTLMFREQIANGKSADDIMCEAFATVREASKRTLGMRHFDVQIIGGVVLHKGMISEMKTGEGKTLMATLPAYLNAVAGKKVHIVTVNGYLAKRDAEWMGEIYKFLGIGVGCITSEHSDAERKRAYSADILYTTNNDVGFDYLRDNLKFSREDTVQQSLDYAIIDEVDSILIDEARTPLIISDSGDESDKELYMTSDSLVKKLEAWDFEKDDKNKSVNLTDEGVTKIECELRELNLISESESLFDIKNTLILHCITQSLKANKMLMLDKDYIVSGGGEVLIVDEFTGRAMKGRRFSEGLHQAIEAKEQVEINPESKTLASTTFQNYFRMYSKLAGMTGTAHTEQHEFWETYGLEVVQIPTNLPVTRKDTDDQIYRTEKEKFKAAVEIISDCYKCGQPILVGTASIEKSERLSEVLKKLSLPHSVLNARYHEMEAGIIAQAGRPKAITIATNMAGRGTDIKLGGNFEMLFKNISKTAKDEKDLKDKKNEVFKKVQQDKKTVLENGGLYVLGTERHESRRIDNQLRGRAGRQGDPGVSKFLVSLEDDLLRIFGSDKIKDLLLKLGMKEGEAIHHPWVSKSLEKAQKRVEARNYEVRKSLLKFDDAVNKQRNAVFSNRNDIIDGEVFDYRTLISHFNKELLNILCKRCNTKDLTQIDYSDYVHLLNSTYEQELFSEQEFKDNESDVLELINQNIISKIAEAEHALLEADVAESAKNSLIKEIVLKTLDYSWREHLAVLDILRHGIGLRAIGQKDPFTEFQKEAFTAFQNMLFNWKESSVKALLAMSTSICLSAQNSKNPEEISRNAVCPCGSGKRYKHCHGMI